MVVQLVLEKKAGSCHCGAVVFQVAFEMNNDEIKNLCKCNCSLCKRRGVAVISVPHEQLSITQGQENLSLYQWNTNVAQHYFCKTCGIYTHHKRRSVPTETSVNIACIEGIDLSRLTGITLLDGASN